MFTPTLLPVVALLALSGSVNAAPVAKVESVDKRWCIFGWGDSCYTAPAKTSSVVVKATSSVVSSSAKASSAVASSSAKASSAVVVASSSASKAAVSSVAPSSTTSASWAKCTAFDWTPFKTNWSWGGFGVDYVQNWYIDNYGVAPPQGMNWNQVSSLVSKYGTKTACSGAKATSVYKKGCSNPWTKAYTATSTASSSSVPAKITSSSSAPAQSSAVVKSSVSAAASVASVSAVPSASASVNGAAASASASQAAAASASASQAAAASASASQAAAASASAAQGAAASASASQAAAASASAAQGAAASSSASAAQAAAVSASAAQDAAASASASAAQAAAVSASAAQAASASQAAAQQVSASISASAAAAAQSQVDADAASASASASAASALSASISASAASATATTAAVTYNGFSAGGCVQEVAGRVLKKVETVSSTNTIESCTALCASYGFQVAGVEYGNECRCGSIDDMANRDVSGQCNMPCAGDASEICGGPNAINWFYNPNIMPATISLPAGWTTYGVVSEGTDGRALTTMLYDDASNTVESCAVACANAGFTVSGTEYSNQCFCGNGFSNGGGALQDDSAAFMWCPGNMAEMCGGPSILSITTSLTGTIPSI